MTTTLTQEQIIEGNKLIAEFMGWHYNSKYNQWCMMEDLTILDGEEYAGEWFRVLKFHSSWDWLLPVIRKIRDYLNNMPERPSKNHCCKGDLIEVDIQCALWEINIENTWQHTVEFIKWYNSQSK
jgi:hypothetical protein